MPSKMSMHWYVSNACKKKSILSSHFIQISFIFLFIEISILENKQAVKQTGKS